MDDIEDFAWIIWCTLLSALLFYLLAQTVRYCTKSMKTQQELTIQRTPERGFAQTDFSSISPVYTISRAAPSIDTETMNNRNAITTTTSATRLSGSSSDNMLEKSVNDGLPTYEEALQIIITPTAPPSISPPIYPTASLSPNRRTNTQQLQYVNNAFSKVE